MLNRVRAELGSGSPTISCRSSGPGRGKRRGASRACGLGSGRTDSTSLAGDAVRFAWRRDFAEWLWDAPKLALDATTAPEVVRQWMPRLEAVDIEVQAPQQRVRQVAD